MAITGGEGQENGPKSNTIFYISYSFIYPGSSLFDNILRVFVFFLWSNTNSTNSSTRVLCKVLLTAVADTRSTPQHHHHHSTHVTTYHILNYD